MSRRNDRVNELLRAEISYVLSRHIKDPRLNGVITVTQVITSSDLRNARVLLSVMGDATVKAAAMEGIQSAATFLRRELRDRITLRYIPFLTFSLDDTLEEADRIFRVMDRVREDSPSDQTDAEEKLQAGQSVSPHVGQ